MYPLPPPAISRKNVNMIRMKEGSERLIICVSECRQEAYRNIPGRSVAWLYGSNTSRRVSAERQLPEPPLMYSCRSDAARRMTFQMAAPYDPTFSLILCRTGADLAPCKIIGRFDPGISKACSLLEPVLGARIQESCPEEDLRLPGWDFFRLREPRTKKNLFFLLLLIEKSFFWTGGEQLQHCIGTKAYFLFIHRHKKGI